MTTLLLISLAASVEAARIVAICVLTNRVRAIPRNLTRERHLDVS
jgi:hypothetical protein